MSVKALSGIFRSFRRPDEKASEGISLRNMRSTKKPAAPKLTYMEILRKFITQFDILACIIALFLLTLLMFLITGSKFYMDGDGKEFNYVDPEVRTYAACAIAVTLPLAIDTGLDYLFCRSAGYIELRFISLSSLITYSIITITTTTNPNFPQIHLVCSYCQIFLEVSIIVWMLYDMDRRNVWTFKRVLSIITLYFLYIFIDFVAYTQDAVYAPSVTLLRELLNFSTYISFIVYSALWLFDFRNDYLAKLKCLRADGRDSGKTDLLTTADYTCLVLIVVPLIVIPTYAVWVYVLQAIEGLPNTDDTTYTADWISGVFVIRSFMTFFTCILPGRIFKQKAIENEYDNEVKSSFVKYMSHEMRTPMNVISMGLELAASQVKEGCLKEDILHTISELEFSSSGALEILDNLLLYEQLEVSSLELNTVEESAIDILCQALKPISKMATGAGIRLNVLDEDRNNLDKLKNVRIKVDKALIAGLMRVLVSRPLRDYKKGAVVNIDMEVVAQLKAVPSMRVRSISRRNQVNPYEQTGAEVLRVTVPLAAPLSVEERDLFLSDSLKFKREANESSGGFGLSVWISKRVMELHGGKIGVLSNGPRSAMYIDIPFTLGNPDPDKTLEGLREFRYASRNAPSSSRDAVSVIARDTRRGSDAGVANPMQFLKASNVLNLLVVDDSDLNRKMIVKVMQSLGHVCTEANDGSVAVEIMAKAIAEKQVFDAVLMDNEMPIMRGRDAVRRMREMGYEGIVLGVTGNALKEDLDDFEENGADMVILKPMTTAKFNDTISHLSTKLLSTKQQL